MKPVTPIAQYREFAYDAPQAIRDIQEYVKETGYPLICTGDLLDSITPENIRLGRELIRETGMMMAAGNHEYWHCFNNRFHFDDVKETYAAKNRSLAQVEEGLEIDIRFSCREIGA